MTISRFIFLCSTTPPPVAMSYPRLEIPMKLMQPPSVFIFLTTYEVNFMGFSLCHSVLGETALNHIFST